MQHPLSTMCLGLCLLLGLLLQTEQSTALGEEDGEYQQGGLSQLCPTRGAPPAPDPSVLALLSWDIAILCCSHRAQHQGSWAGPGVVRGL